MTDKSEQALRQHERTMHRGAAGNNGGQEGRSMLPSPGAVLQAGAFGAALGGITAGVTETARVKQGEITTDEAVSNVIKSTGQSAVTMIVASVAGQVVRSHPLIGLAALAAAGIGAVVMLSNAGKVKEAVVETADAADTPDEPEAKPRTKPASKPKTKSAPKPKTTRKTTRKPAAKTGTRKSARA